LANLGEIWAKSGLTGQNLGEFG